MTEEILDVLCNGLCENVNPQRFAWAKMDSVQYGFEGVLLDMDNGCVYLVRILYAKVKGV